MITDSNEILFIIYFFAALLILGIILSLLARDKGGEDENSLEKRLERALPQVQCAQCGYVGCKEYARAMAAGEVGCNKCTPGGPDTINDLAEILGIDPPEDNEGDDMLFVPRTVAFVHSSACTGCTKCKRVCPVDAISGAARQAHLVDPEECIGCNDCVKICPENCIELIRLDPTVNNFNWEIKSIKITGGGAQ